MSAENNLVLMNYILKTIQNVGKDQLPTQQFSMFACFTVRSESQNETFDNSITRHKYV